jgi:hypothetical protein
VYSPGVVHPDDVGDAFKKQCKLVQVRFPMTYLFLLKYHTITQAPGSVLTIFALKTHIISSAFSLVKRDAFKKQCKLVQAGFPITYGTYFSNIVTQALVFIGWDDICSKNTHYIKCVFFGKT